MVGHRSVPTQTQPATMKRLNGDKPSERLLKKTIDRRTFLQPDFFCLFQNYFLKNRIYYGGEKKGVKVINNESKLIKK